jgi:hypothetical protein
MSGGSVVGRFTGQESGVSHAHLSPSEPMPMTIGLQFASDGLVDLHEIIFSTVPEPSTFALLGTSLLTGVGLLLRRRKNRR